MLGTERTRESIGGSRRRRLTWGIAGSAVVIVLLVVALWDMGTQADPSSTSEPDGDAALEASSPSVDDLGLSRRLAGDVTAIGKIDAPVVMIEYADYRCPFCGVFAQETMPQLVTDYVESGLVRYEWRDLPVFGEESVAAAIAARAAGEQGRFWQYQDAVFSNAPKRGHISIDRAKLVEFAGQAGVPDVAAFTLALDDPMHRAAVQVDATEAQKIGATSTPIFMIGTTPVIGAQPLEVFQQVIDDEIALAERN